MIDQLLIVTNSSGMEKSNNEDSGIGGDRRKYQKTLAYYNFDM